MASSPEIEVFPTKRLAAQSLAELVCDRSAESIANRGRFSIALAGGSTPATLYRILAARPFARDIDWSRWHVFWGDERCVPPDHPDSNYGMARRTVLDRVRIPPSQVYRMAGEDPPAQAAVDYERTLSDVLGPGGRLDLVLLGMGDDGHTASLFPGTAALDEREGLVAANWVPHLNDHRLTLTLPAINAARCVAVFVAGRSKARAVRRTLDPAPRDETPPIALVAPVDSPVHWYLTRSAYPSFRRMPESRGRNSDAPPSSVRPEGNRKVNGSARPTGKA